MAQKPSGKPRLIIVTGVSGSGRASAMRVLEDLDFYCVDNLPVALVPEVLRLAADSTRGWLELRSESTRANGCSFRSGRASFPNLKPTACIRK